MHVRSRLSVSTEDLVAGQAVIVAARWVLIGAGLVFALWDPITLNELRLQLLVLFLLGLVNFYLQAQATLRRATLSEIVYAASAADLVVISLLVTSGHGLSSELFIFYFPALVALSVSFDTELTALFTIFASGLYGTICVAYLQVDGMTNSSLRTLFGRMLMFAAVAICGNLYWRVERQRRRDADAAASLSDNEPPRPETPNGAARTGMGASPISTSQSAPQPQGKDEP